MSLSLELSNFGKYPPHEKEARLYISLNDEWECFSDKKFLDKFYSGKAYTNLSLITLLSLIIG